MKNHAQARWGLSKKALYNCMVFSRVIAGFIGGYILTAYITMVLAELLPMSRADAVVLASLLSYVWFCMAIIWVFAVKSALKAWLGILAGIALFAAVHYSLKTFG